MDRLPLAWRPGLVGAALVLVACAAARPASLRRTARRVLLLASRAAGFVGELVVLVEHRSTRRRRAHQRNPWRPMAGLANLVDRRVVQPAAARRRRIGVVPRVTTPVLVALAVATFAPSAAWVASDRWPDNPLGRTTRSAFSRWSVLEDRLHTAPSADVAAEQVAGPSTSAVVARRLAWYVAGGVEPIRFGDPGDVPATADLDGDGVTELLTFAPATGTWQVAGWAEPVVLDGREGDVPVPADYDGDGTAELAVFRPSTGEWLIDGVGPARLGGPDDVPVPAAYGVAGVTVPAVYRPATGEWLIGAAAPVRFGEPDDVPAPADFDGDGLADVAVFRPATGEWWVMGGSAEPIAWGTEGDVPVPGPYFAARRAVPAVYRPATGELLVIGHDAIDTGLTYGVAHVGRRDDRLTVIAVDTAR